MNNPMQMMVQFSQYINNYRGNPQQEAMRMIQQSGMNQQQLNKLQNTANAMYSLAQRMGIIR